jgi:hypothetical protein
LHEWELVEVIVSERPPLLDKTKIGMFSNQPILVLRKPVL